MFVDVNSVQPLKVNLAQIGTHYSLKIEQLYGARFRQDFTLEGTVGSHARSIEALACM
jgi:hypothetical protein